MTNTMAKTRKVNDPYEVYENPQLPGWQWRVLKKYQTPENEAKNPYARWFCAVKSPMTEPDYDMGDTYVTDIMDVAGAVKVDFKKENLEQWKQY